MKTFVKLWILFILIVTIHPMQAQRRRPDYRISQDYNAKLQLEESRKWIHTALAALEKTDKDFLKYINPETAPIIDLKTFKLEDETRPLSSDSPFSNLKSGSSYFRISFLCKPEYADTFTHSYAAMVYLKKDDGMPFCLKFGNSPKLLPITFQEKPILQDLTRTPQWIDVPNGYPTLTKEEREQLITIARRFIEKENPEVFQQLIPVLPVITMHQLHPKEGENRSIYQIYLFCRDSVAIVSVQADNKQAIALRFDSTMP